MRAGMSDFSNSSRTIEGAIAEGVFPGACYAVVSGETSTRRHGRYTYCPESPEVQEDTIWDLASVSKVVGMTTAAMLLHDDGLLKLDEPVAQVLPEFAQNGKQAVTVRNLLIHDSGLVAFRPYHRTYTTAEAVWQAVAAEALTFPTGSKMVYSDLSMITMHKVVEKLASERMEAMLERRVWKPLGMVDTQYNPGLGNPRCAPTESVEPWRENLRRLRNAVSAPPEFSDAAFWIQGEVHDPTATVLGGVAGHAGLFSTVGDLVKFAQMMLADGAGLIKPETVRLFTTRNGPASTRGLGWDTKSERGSSAGSRFGARSYGHTGYTGTSMWIDPDAKVAAILLTNRVHPTSENTRIIQFRPRFHDSVREELGR
jgi:CubicO group peptidase (beta-lactamase class C family)